MISALNLIVLVFSIISIAGVVFIWMRLERPKEEDPRLSRGLQLLQSKLSVLEDLSDRVDHQVGQLSSLLEKKTLEVHEMIMEAEKQIHIIDQKLKKSLEVSEIFQDRIPHQEIIERQNTIKYVTAAKLAYAGLSVEDIAARVELSIGEIEVIAKINRGQLMFSEEHLPEWAKKESEGVNQELVSQNDRPQEQFLSNRSGQILQVNLPQKGLQAENELKQLGEKFAKGLSANGRSVQFDGFDQSDFYVEKQSTLPPTHLSTNALYQNNEVLVQNGKKLEVKPFQFKKIEAKP